LHELQRRECEVAQLAIVAGYACAAGTHFLMAVTSPRLLHPWHLNHSIADYPRNPPPTTATVDLWVTFSGIAAPMQALGTAVADGR
jgi:hypothetical protein